MALANDDLLLVQRHMESYKISAGNLKDYVNAGDTQGTVTELSAGDGITLSPTVITDKGTISSKIWNGGGLGYDGQGHMYVLVDLDTIFREADGTLYVKRAPYADEAGHAVLADRATVADSTNGNSASADYSRRVIVTNTDTTARMPLTFTDSGINVTGNNIYIDSDDLWFRASDNVLYSKGGFLGNLDGNAETASLAAKADTIKTTLSDSTSTAADVLFAPSGPAYRNVNYSAKLKYQPNTGTLFASSFSGPLDGTADHAKTVTIQYGNNSNGTYQMLWGSGNYVYGTSGITCNPSQNSITSSMMYTSNWFRSTGASGWYSQSYGGGIYMEDSYTVKVYGSKMFQVNNEIRATGDVKAFYSDERLKTRVGEIESPLDKVLSLTGFYYKENESAKAFGYNSDKTLVGLSAQEVQKVLPEVVDLAPFDTTQDDNGKDVSKSGEDYLTVNYGKLVPLLVEAIKEQQKQIDELKGKL